jgi:tetratricopeptide (TPR) repeat protein
MALADYYLATGNYAEARKHAELVGESGSANPHENLARIALAEGKLDEAERESRAALERYPNRRIPHMILGRVARDRRDYAGALAELTLAAKAQESGGSPPLQSVNFLRGDCLARMGREGEAEAAFLQELHDFPSSPAPRTALAMLYASQGRESDARGALTRLVEDLKTPEAYFAAARTYEVLGDPRSAEELRAQARKAFPRARERKDTG